MSRTRALVRGPVVLVPVAALLLTACGGADPAEVRRAEVAALTAAANDRDADGVRRSAESLVALLQEQRAQGDVDAAEADRLTALAASVAEGADVIDEDLQQRRAAEAAAEQAQRELEAERARAEQAVRELEERQAAEVEPAPAPEEGRGNGKDKDKDEDD